MAKLVTGPASATGFVVKGGIGDVCRLWSFFAHRPEVKNQRGHR
jgi:hypothetical protein